MPHKGTELISMSVCTALGKDLTKTFRQAHASPLRQTRSAVCWLGYVHSRASCRRAMLLHDRNVSPGIFAYI